MTMWQKARIIDSTIHRELIGREFWIEARPPVEKPTRDIETGTRLKAEPLFNANIRDGRGSVCVAPRGLELLPEFAEDVEMISWEDFLKGDAMAKGGFQR
jgi:hypothetical protein